MALQVSCWSVDSSKAEVIIDTFRDNHGTAPGDVDMAGDIILDEVHAEEVEGSRADFEALVAAFDGCECDTAFLSLDALEDEGIQALVGSLTDYLSQFLVCSGDVDTAGLVALLIDGNLEAALPVLENCMWTGGGDLEGGFDEALQEVILQGQEVLGDYHVCNNDASIQAQLWADFVAGEAPVCDTASPVCSGPMWFYTPGT